MKQPFALAMILIAATFGGHVLAQSRAAVPRQSALKQRIENDRLLEYAQMIGAAERCGASADIARRMATELEGYFIALRGKPYRDIVRSTIKFGRAQPDAAPTSTVECQSKLLEIGAVWQSIAEANPKRGNANAMVLAQPVFEGGDAETARFLSTTLHHCAEEPVRQSYGADVAGSGADAGSPPPDNQNCADRLLMAGAGLEAGKLSLPYAPARQR